MASSTTNQSNAKQELVAYLNTLNLDGLEADEIVESAEGILEWGIEQLSTEDAEQLIASYGYSKEEAKRITQIVHASLK